MANVRSFSCPACGAPIPPDATRCGYCGRYLSMESATDDTPEHLQTQDAVETFDRWVFERRTEPRENAFTLSVPRGWLLEGGIIRADLAHQAPNVQAIEAKIDFTVKQDAQGGIAVRWCPEVKYCDLRHSMVSAMFPPGSSYQGMMVMPLMSAVDFLQHVVFPWAHPAASNVIVTATQREPLLVEGYRQRMTSMGLPANFGYDGAIVTFAYSEDGLRFEEKSYAVIENLGALAGGMWSNKDTLLLRAPEGRLAEAEPLLHHIRESVRLNDTWVAREIASQEILTRHFLNAQQAELARNRRMQEIQQQIQQINREIADHRARTNAEIHNDAYLTLMNQEEYINPHTGYVETGSNQWRHRWVTDGGEEFYTDHEEDDPNIAGLLNRTDWKRTPVRPRFPNT